MTELLFRDDAYLKTASARVVVLHDGGIELDRTIFYPLGGGQLGDTGTLLRANGERIVIADTRKGDTVNGVLHIPASAAPQLEIGEPLTLEIDWERRYALPVAASLCIARETSRVSFALTNGPMTGALPSNVIVQSRCDPSPRLVNRNTPSWSLRIPPFVIR